MNTKNGWSRTQNNVLLANRTYMMQNILIARGNWEQWKKTHGVSQGNHCKNGCKSVIILRGKRTNSKRNSGKTKDK